MNTQEQNVLEEIETALHSEESQRAQAAELRSAAASAELKKVSRISTLLRYLGVAVLITGIGSFMFQHWSTMLHLERYFMFLGFTAVVCGAGLVCGISIKESKGARTLLGAVTWLIPVHCAQLGAIIYSQVGVLEPSCPPYFYWHVPSLHHALLALGVGLAALVPMAYISYAVLARRYAPQLSTVGLGISALLIVPSREPATMTTLLAIGAITLVMMESSLAGSSELRTREGLIARTVPFLALAMLIGRQLHIYNASTVMLGIIFGIISAILFEVVPRLFSGRFPIAVAEALSLVCVVISGLLTLGGIVDALRLKHSPFTPVLIGVSIAAILSVMAVKARAIPGAFRVTASVSIFLTGILEILGAYGVSGCVIALALGIMSIAWACVVEARLALILGGILTAVALLNSAQLALDSLSMSPWVTLGLIGVATVVGASYFERNFLLVRDCAVQLRHQVRNWK